VKYSVTSPPKFLPYTTFKKRERENNINTFPSSPSLPLLSPLSLSSSSSAHNNQTFFSRFHWRPIIRFLGEIIAIEGEASVKVHLKKSLGVVRCSEFLGVPEKLNFIKWDGCLA
jgi:hypothetical protein